VKVVHEDDQTDAQAAVQAARKLVDAENSTCIAGSWASSASIPVARSVAIREKVLQISPASTSDEISGLEDDGLINRTSPPDRFQGPTLANAMEDALGGAQGKTVNIGARNDAYGTGLSDTFSKAWEDKGGQIGERVIYDPEQPSYNSEARQIASGNPDAWVIVDFPETYQKVGPALVRTGDWDPEKSFVTDGLASGDLPKNAGREATEGMRGTAPGSPDTGSASEAFDKLYTDAPGPDRQTFDAQNFDAVILCYLSAVAAGSTDGADMAGELQNVAGPGGDKFTWEQLPDAIRALQDGNDIDYEGASGPLTLNDDGDPTSGVYDLFRYRNGEIDVFDETAVEAPGT
jgi:branched-chain amino acid transport system substrate-binding protein